MFRNACGLEGTLVLYKSRSQSPGYALPAEPLPVPLEKGNAGSGNEIGCVLIYNFVPRSREPTKDGVIATFDEHEDSVYAVEWSTADPWVFASLSYDGRLVINRVPRAEKYKILL